MNRVKPRLQQQIKTQTKTKNEPKLELQNVL